MAPSVVEDLLSGDAARRAQGFAVTGADSVWDRDFNTAGANLAMTILNTRCGHRENIADAGRMDLRPITAPALFQRFADILADLPLPPPKAPTDSSRADAES
jgi:hypothetical protein